MNLIKLALEEAIKDFKKIIDTKSINVNLVEIVNDKENITKSKDIFLYATKNNTKIGIDNN